MANETTTEKKPVDYAGQTEGTTSAMKALSGLTWDERKAFMRRFTDVFNQESDLQSQGKGGDFDTQKYN